MNKETPATVPGVRDLTADDYERVRRIALRVSGINLGDSRQQMVRARLNKRLRHIGANTFLEYLDLLEEGRDDSAEMVAFVNAITTNKTEFFRENHHFEFLAKEWAPTQVAQSRRSQNYKLRIWCAASSTGQEPYSIAITLHSALMQSGDPWDIRILASDIDTNVLETARAGIYCEEDLLTVPEHLRRRYFLRGRGANAGVIQVHPDIRAMISFRRINYIDPRWPIRDGLDMIFCRNALIYFDRPTKATIVSRFSSLLRDHGFLIIGHSEALEDRQFQLLGKTIYRKESWPSPETGVHANPKTQ